MRLPTLVLLFVPGIVELAAPSLAAAADLTYRAPVADLYVAAPVAAASYDWSGFYAGFNLGYGLGEEDPVDLQAFPDAAGATFGSIAPEGLLGGVQAGFNVQHGSLVFGLEGDFQLTDVSGEASETLSGVTATSATTLDWYGTLRPRIGVSTGPALIYATGGLALGDLNGTIDALGPNGETGQLETSDDVALGYTVGGGVEYALNDMVSIKGEYLFTHLEAEARGSVADANGADMGLEPNSWINADIHTIKAGLNFHF
jgi:outer membrane immunogenic protein